MNMSKAGLPQDDRIEQASTWCLRLADGSLPPAARAAFDEWLAADTENARAFDDAVRTWQALEDARLSPELIAMRRGALESFRQGHASRWNRRSARHRTRWMAVAASLALVAIMAGLWMRFVPQRYETGLGERRVVALKDGSRVSLDAQSRVDVRYSGGRRELWLRHGRAKFQVAKDPLRPFSVSAADKIVVATGTEFSVEMLASQVHVILYKGSVEVLAEQPGSALQPVRVKQRPEPASQSHPGTVLFPGRELVASLANPVVEVKPADPVRSLTWEGGQLAFSNEPLSSAVERMNRYADVPLLIGDPAAGHVRISGVFAAGDTEAFVEGVTGIFPVQVRDVDGKRSLVSTR